MDRNREEHRENVLNRHRLNGRHRRLLNGSQHFTLLDTYGSMTLPRHITLTLLLDGTRQQCRAEGKPDWR
jgi:hypothetical protein